MDRFLEGKRNIISLKKKMTSDYYDLTILKKKAFSLKALKNFHINIINFSPFPTNLKEMF